MEVRVEGSLERAMRVLKKKLAAEGVFKEMKIRAFYEKPSVRRKRKRQEAERKRRKALRRAQRQNG
ncbi:MAG: 30S ribosomal protein S21 [Deltaproteobacteria bacterium]|nr:30S ribosomal protein S21 [Deltaproteobacteria bacterium]